MVAPTGKAGGVLMFHCNIVHASPPNIGPYDRRVVYLAFFHTDSCIRKFPVQVLGARITTSPHRTLAGRLLRAVGPNLENCRGVVPL
ncbi:MAG: phytanoyl-CoA dioxygenase family protein [Rhodospirillales bacterium]|nr:phytanoyl-CoA dioxygenase family protein [Rhodospirillales bacterium]